MVPARGGNASLSHDLNLAAAMRARAQARRLRRWSRCLLRRAWRASLREPRLLVRAHLNPKGSDPVFDRPLMRLEITKPLIELHHLAPHSRQLALGDIDG